ncbi:MAG: cell wall-binding protein [bacterium]|nr:cell wall-binding protein [bacterium]
MKKETKFLAVLSAAALMAVFSPQLTEESYAASKGWTQENGAWVFYDAEGYLETDTWKKADGVWYYLDSDGYLAFNQKVDDRYVGADGAMVTNTWIAVENEEDWDAEDSPSQYWYYFDKNGKAVTSRWYSIGDKEYYFNEDGQMQTGLIEVDGYTYYCGEEGNGAMQHGWVYFEEDVNTPDYEDTWSYFDNKGRRIDNQVDKKIDGKYYTFVDGRMQTGWVKVGTASVTNADGSTTDNLLSNYQHYGTDSDGSRSEGWLNLEGIDGIHTPDESYWFYFKNGKPHAASHQLEVFTIDSKKYCFNEKGELQTGLKNITLADGSSANFYFGEEDEGGAMKTGKQTIYDEASGDTFTWFFYTDGSKKGQGMHGIYDNAVYVQGKRQDANEDLRYAPAVLDEVSYLVNTKGVLQKAGKSSKSSERADLGAGYRDFKDENNKIWVVDTEGRIVQ